MQLCSQKFGADNVMEIDKLRNSQAVAKSAAGSLDESICILGKDMAWLLNHIEQLEKMNTQRETR
jgi:hypothetical protein